MKEMLTICPKCGFVTVLDTEKFCPNCGVKLLKKCPGCDAAINHPLAEYCSVCGMKYLRNERKHD